MPIMPRRAATWRHAVLWLWLAAALLSSGCATTFDNAPLNRPATAPAAGLAANPGRQNEEGGETAVALSLSGGGLRAAAFALGVLRELAHGPVDVFDDIRFVSSVSGGSLTAAYLALEGRAGLESLHERVLLRNFERDLRLSLWSPGNVLRLLAGGLNDRSNLGEVLDRDVFHGATFADMAQRRGPEVWINATDLYNRTPFPFLPQVFQALCSDLGGLRVSEAVAASMAVPLAFTPVVLKTYPEHCAAPLPPWAAQAAQDRGGVSASLLTSVARAVLNYRNPERMRYVKLADGGLTDNQGLSSILVARAAAGTPHDPLSERAAVQLRRLLFLVVDAGRPPSGEWALQADGPDGMDVGLAAADAAVDSATRLSLQAFRAEMQRWQEQVLRFRCALPPERVRELLPAGRAWDCRDLRFDVEVLSFDSLPEGLAARLQRMPTRLTLSRTDVDAAVEGGRMAARSSGQLAAYRHTVLQRAPR